MAGLKQGSIKLTVRSAKAIFRLKDVAALSAHFLQAGKPEDADFIAVAFHFMLRVQSELAPLRAAERQPAGQDWHSHVFLQAAALPAHRAAATIHLQSRKNDPKAPPSGGPATATRASPTAWPAGSAPCSA